MNRLLVATTNPGKRAEIKTYLSDVLVDIISLSDIGIMTAPEETGTTFKENALIKARYYCQLSGLPTIADDGGFEIDVLGGQPGIRSHRWIGGDRDDLDEALISYTLQKIEGVPRAKRGAQLRLVMAFVLPDGKEYTVEAVQRGIIPEHANKKRVIGYPYRSLLFFPEVKKYYNELTDEEHDRYNHRKRAIQLLKKDIIRHLC